jgi:Cupin
MQHGTLSYRLGFRRSKTLGQGERLVIPQGALHACWNAGDSELTAIVEFRPAFRTIQRSSRAPLMRAQHLAAGGADERIPSGNVGTFTTLDSVSPARPRCASAWLSSLVFGIQSGSPRAWVDRSLDL